MKMLTVFEKKELEGFSKSVIKELNPKWDIKDMIVATGGVNTKFHSNLQIPDQHLACANDPESPLTGLANFMSKVNMADKAGVAERGAAVVFDIVVGQNERLLLLGLSLRAETLKYVGDEIQYSSKELKEWGAETVKVTPASNKA